MNCGSCKYWQGDENTYIAACGLYGNNVASNHTCASYTPHAPEKPEPMRQYPPTGEAIRVGMMYHCATCGSLDISATKCHHCGLALVVRP